MKRTVFALSNFYNCVIELIPLYNSSLTAVAKHKVIDDPLYLEVLNHATMAEKRTEAFVGRKHFLEKVTALPKRQP